MAYQINGNSHFSGIKNEKDVVGKLNNLKNETFLSFVKEIAKKSPYKYIHVGGTKYKKDASAISEEGKEIFDISIKKHKSGTFDYINTSNLKKYVDENLVNNINIQIENLKNKFKSKFQNQIKEEKLIDSEHTKMKVRCEIKKISSQILNKINSDMIKKLFTKIKNEEPKLLIVNNESANKLVFIKKKYREDIHNIMQFNENDFYQLKKKVNAIESRTIYKNNNDTGIRLRVVLNNGITAFLGGNPNKPKSNKNASFTIKLQNDNVSNFFKSKKILSL